MTGRKVARGGIMHTGEKFNVGCDTKQCSEDKKDSKPFALETKHQLRQGRQDERLQNRRSAT